MGVRTDLFNLIYCVSNLCVYLIYIYEFFLLRIVLQLNLIELNKKNKIEQHWKWKHGTEINVRKKKAKIFNHTSNQINVNTNILRLLYSLIYLLIIVMIIWYSHDFYWTSMCYQNNAYLVNCDCVSCYYFVRNKNMICLQWILKTCAQIVFWMLYILTGFSIHSFIFLIQNT